MKKGLKILGLVLLLLAVVLLAFPVIFKKQISDRVKQEINSQINGQVDYSDLSFSFFSHFPNATISLHNFSLTGQPPTNNKIASVKELSVTVDLGSLISGHNYKVISIFISGADFNLKVTDDGRPDWKVLKYDVDFSKASKPEPDQPQADFSLQVNNWKIERTNIVFSNDIARTYFELKGLNATGTQLLDNNVMKLQSSTTADALSYTAGGIRYLASARLNADVHFSAEPSTQLYTFKDNVIQLNDLHLKLDGTLKNGIEGQDFNLKIVSVDTTFKTLLSLIPTISNDTNEKLNATGSFAFSGSLKGLHQGNQYPALAFDTRVINGTFKAGYQKAGVVKINLITSATKPQGLLDAMVIRSQVQVATGTYDTARMVVIVTTPYTDPNIQAQIEGSFMASIIPDVYDGDDGSGLYVQFNLGGRKSDFDKKKYSRLKTEGYATLSGCLYKPSGVPVAADIQLAVFSIHPDFISMDKLTAFLGKDKVNGNGRIEHLTSYLEGVGRPVVNIHLYSDYFSPFDLRTDYEPYLPKAQLSMGTASKSDKIVKTSKSPTYPLLSINFSVKKVGYHQLGLMNLKGRIQLNGDKLEVQNTTADLFDGSVSLVSTNDHISSPTQAVNFNIGYSNISMQELNRTLRSSGVEVSSLQNINGSFSGQLKGTGLLNADRSVNYRSIHADGKTTCPDLKIDELPMLMDIARMAKVKSFEHMEAKNILCNFHFNNGKTTVDPTDIKFTTGTNINFKGICDASQNVDADIALDVPVREFGQVGSLAQSLLGSFMKVPENMQFKFKLTGPMNRPAVRVTGIGPSDN